MTALGTRVVTQRNELLTVLVIVCVDLLWLILDLGHFESLERLINYKRECEDCILRCSGIHSGQTLVSASSAEPTNHFTSCSRNMTPPGDDHPEGGSRMKAWTHGVFCMWRVMVARAGRQHDSPA
jgi:hypothetical protein